MHAYTHLYSNALTRIVPFRPRNAGSGDEWNAYTYMCVHTLTHITAFQAYKRWQRQSHKQAMERFELETHYPGHDPLVRMYVCILVCVYVFLHICICTRNQVCVCLYLYVYVCM